MKQINLIRCNLLDNDYYNSEFFGDINRWCLESQDELLKENDTFNFKKVDYTYKHEFAIEAAKTNDCIEKVLKFFKCKSKREAIKADHAIFYYLSKVKNVLYLDDDILIYNKKKFLEVFKEHKDENFKLDDILHYNNDNLEIYTEIFNEQNRIQNNRLANYNNEGILFPLGYDILNTKIKNVFEIGNYIAHFDDGFMWINNADVLEKADKRLKLELFLEILKKTEITSVFLTSFFPLFANLSDERIANSSFIKNCRKIKKINFININNVDRNVIDGAAKYGIGEEFKIYK